MNAGTAIVLVIVIVIVVLALRAMTKKNAHGCCGGGDECGACGGDCQGRAKIYGINVDAAGNAMDCSKEGCPHCHNGQ